MELDTDLMDDDDEVIEAIDELSERFVEWLEARPTEGVDPGHVGLFLQWKAFAADGHLGRWVREDIDELLLEELPRRLAVGSEEVRDLPATLAAFLRMLDEQGLLAPPRSDQQEVHRQLARALEQTGWSVSEETRFDHEVSYTSPDGWTASGWIVSFEDHPRADPYVGVEVRIDGAEPCTTG